MGHRPLSLNWVISIIDQSVQVLAHLHLTVHIGHRDIKPENIIVRDTSEKIVIKFADFDLAVPCGSVTNTCSSLCGTMPFVAPEVVLADRYNARMADIWSLGIVFV